MEWMVAILCGWVGEEWKVGGGGFQVVGWSCGLAGCLELCDDEVEEDAVVVYWAAIALFHTRYVPCLPIACLSMKGWWLLCEGSILIILVE